MTTVAAGTHNRDGQGSVTLGNGVTYSGASVATPRRSRAAHRLDGRRASRCRRRRQLALCYGAADGGAVLDPAKVAGKIVVCDRGVTARVEQEPGGPGGRWRRDDPRQPVANSINADFHFVPTVHLQNTDRAAVKAYAATAGATATINQATIVSDAPAPFTATFSSRGPLPRGGGDLLKPDVIAPGQDILAAVAPPGNARPRLRPLQRHVDVQPARGRPRGAAQGPAPDLVADGDQVGAHDDGLRRARRRHPGPEHQPGR